MRKSLSVLTALAGLALMGAAPAEFMLCFHRDGKIVLESYQERCCASEDECPKQAASDCPDDQCRDLPLTIEADGGLDAPSVDAPPPASTPCLIDASSPDGARPPELAPPRSEALDPPESPPLTFLRTVVLRQ